jgi:hypothetical protein
LCVEAFWQTEQERQFACEFLRKEMEFAYRLEAYTADPTKQYRFPRLFCTTLHVCCSDTCRVSKEELFALLYTLRAVLRGGAFLLPEFSERLAVMGYCR